MLLTNLAWEIVHLPLYTLWSDSSWGYLVFVVFHCSAGDLMIAYTTLCIALLLVGNLRDPGRQFHRVLGLTLLLGIAYTVYSEWLNVYFRHSWAYSDLMPVVPLIETGASPLAQWMLLPLLGLLWARKKYLDEENANEL